MSRPTVRSSPQQRPPVVRYVAPRYDNRYVLDITVAAALLLIGTFLLALYEAFVFFLDYENSMDKVTLACDGVILFSSALFLAGAALFMSTCYPEELQNEMSLIAGYSDEKVVQTKYSWGQRFVYGSSILITMWLFLLATLPLIAVPILKYQGGSYDVAYCVVYELILATGLALLLFWLVASFPENMARNGGRGSSMFYDTFLACLPASDCCGEDDLLQLHLGSDFLVGSWLFFVGAGIFFAIVVYYAYVQYQYLLIYCALLGAIFTFVGATLLVYCSYPDHMFARVWWCLITCQKGERWVAEEDRAESDRVDSERRRLI